MIAGTLEIEMLANVARLRKDMADAKSVVGSAMASVEQSVNLAKNALGALGVGLSVGYFAHLVKSSIEATGRLKDLAQEAGTTAEEISKFEAPARMAGLGLESVSNAIFKMSKAALDAKDPLSVSAQALNSIGLKASDLKGLKPDEMFEKVARSVAKYSDGLEKNNVTQTLFGKSGKEMNRVIAEIADTSKLAATVTNEQAEAADKLGDQMVELQMNSEKMWRGMLADVVPAVNEVVKAFIEARKEGGLLDGVFAAIGTSFDKLKGTPTEQLKKLNDQIKQAEENDRTRSERNIFGIESKAAYDLNEMLARRSVLEKQIFDQELAAQDKRATALGGSGKPTIKFDPKAQEEARKGLIAYNNEAASLEMQLAKLNGEGELEAYVNKLNTDAYKNLTEEQRLNLETRMESVLIRKDEIEATKLQIQSAIEYVKAEEALTDSLEGYLQALRDSSDQMEFDTSLIGQSAEAVARLTEMRRRDAAMIQAVKALGPNASSVDVQKIIDANEVAKKQAGITMAVNAALAEQESRWKSLESDAGKYFGTMGAGFGKMMATLVNYGDKEADLAKRREEYSKIADPKKRAEMEELATRQEVSARLGAYGDMADAASQFFDKQSRGYAILQGVSKAFHMAEIALQIASIAPKLMAGAATMFGQSGWGGFVGVAAMGAVMAGLGYSMSSSGSTSAPSAKDVQAAQGTGSVLGNSNAKSESITKALELISKSSLLGNEYMSAMTRSLHSIDSNIGGLAALVVRAGVLTGADTSGMALGTKANLPAWAGFLTGSAGGTAGSILSGGLTNVIGAIFGGLFGKTSRTLTDSGIQFGSQSIGQARQGVNASGYANITTNSSSFFGLFKSSSTSTETSALSKEITNQFTMIVNGLFNSILAAGKIFGSDPKAIEAVLNAFQIDFTKISFKDLTGEEIQKQLEAVFSKLGDDMAAAAFPGLEKFQKVGEGTLETLTRLAQEFAATDAIMIMTGRVIADAFGAVGFASMEARDNLVQLFGGIEEMSDAVTKYYEAFYSESEQLANSINTLTGQFDVMGISVPASIEDYRKLVDAQDLSTEAGRSFYAELILLGPAFAKIQTAMAKMKDDIFDAADTISGGKLGVAMRKAEEQAAAANWNALWKQLTGQDGSVAATLANVHQYSSDPAVLASMIEAAYKQGGEPAVEALKRLFVAVSANTDALDENSKIGQNAWWIANQAQIDEANRTHDARAGIGQYLQNSLLGDTSPLTPMQRLAEAKRQYEANLALAQGGDVNALSNFGSTRDAYLQIARQIYASSGAYNDIFNSTFMQGNSLAGTNFSPYGKQDAIAQTDRIVAVIMQSNVILDALYARMQEPLPVEDSTVATQLEANRVQSIKSGSGALTNPTGEMA